MEVRAVLLDVDGTLIDSNDAHAHAWVDVGAELGHDIGFDEVRWLIGMGGDKVLPKLTGLDEESDEGRQVKERRGEIFRERYLPMLGAFPDAVELVERLRDEGRTLVVATSASEKDLRPMLEHVGLEWLVDDATDADDADESKPAPDIVEAALAKSGTDAAHAVMLGDTPYDIEAAQRAGVRIIALRCGGWTDEDLRGADEIYDAPADLLRRYGGSLLRRTND